MLNVASPDAPVFCIQKLIQEQEGVAIAEQLVSFGGNVLGNPYRRISAYGVQDGCTVSVAVRMLGGSRGMDMQNRVGNKPGSGQASSAQTQIDRRERLRKLAMETIDLSKDKFFMRNHLGSYECKLCLTLHNTEGNYLAHTQGKRHQTNLARRAAREARDNPALPQPLARARVARKKSIKIGRPGYKVTKQRDPETGQRSLLFEVSYPEIEEGLQPRHRFMSAYEQHVEAPDKKYQYVLFAADPYETIGFKVPNQEIDKSEGKFFTNWDVQKLVFSLQLHFKEDETDNGTLEKPSGRPKTFAPWER